MRVVACTILIIVVLGLFIYGYYIMGRLDRFLSENYKNMPEDTHPVISPVCMDVTKEIHDETLDRELKDYIKEHDSISISDEEINTLVDK